ncbi:hypothetical protein [Kitasatospora sp. SUK 42]|uniref:hypothetical protein n=1 Tax=Kitasatospora sp. SUK 42 TaxID=1588882 RepID=UPI0018CB49E0|nr:hypothetical protein [Kitasatospora sp. SUK 42]MBV2156752.1 hypothetical protein [Kitasatospora sp. SUK 42]
MPLSEPAPPSAQWIVDTLSTVGSRPEQCPKPTLATLAVLDTDGDSRAAAFWLVDNVDVCVVTIRNPIATGVTFIPIDDLTKERPFPTDSIPNMAEYIVTAFPGQVDGIRVVGSPDHVLGPAHTRTVDLGDGKFVTFVEYRIVTPQNGDDLPLSLCPASGECRDAYIPRLVTDTPEPSPRNAP